MQKRPRTSSPVWSLFSIREYVNETYEAHCKVCGARIAGPNSSNFTRHFQHIDDDIHREGRKLLGIQSQTLNTLDSFTFFTRSYSESDDKLVDSCSSSLALNGISISFAHSNEFRQFLRQFAADKRPVERKISSLHQSSIRESIIKQSQRSFDDVITILMNSPSFVSIIIDGATIHTRGPKSTNIIALHNGETHFLWSHLNDKKDSAEDYLIPLLASKIEFLIEKGVAISSIISDNASNMGALGRGIYSKFQFNGAPVILHVRCAAHVLQLAINQILDLPLLADLFNYSIKIVDAFVGEKGAKSALIKLRALQLADSEFMKKHRNPLKILGYNATRWWSRAVSIGRLIELRVYIGQVSLDRSLSDGIRNKLRIAQRDNYWKALEEFYEFCCWFRLATNIVESDSATLLSVRYVLVELERRIQSWKPSNLSEFESEGASATFSDDAIEELKLAAHAFLEPEPAEFGGEHYALASADLLTSEVFVSHPAPVVEWLKKWGAAFISFYDDRFYLGESTPPLEEIETRISDQLFSFNQSLNIFSRRAIELNECKRPVSYLSFHYKKGKPLSDQPLEIDWLRFWRKKRNDGECNELAGLAVCILSIGASEAPCERSFSLEKLNWSAQRNSMNGELIEAETRLRFNSTNRAKKRAEREIERQNDNYELEDSTISEETEIIN